MSTLGFLSRVIEFEVAEAGDGARCCVCDSLIFSEGSGSAHGSCLGGHKKLHRTSQLPPPFPPQTHSGNATNTLFTPGITYLHRNNLKKMATKMSHAAQDRGFSQCATPITHQRPVPEVSLSCQAYEYPCLYIFILLKINRA